jgi:hypothetical protein
MPHAHEPQTRKTCFKCDTEKPLADFYEHKMMKDGRLGKCKECAKADSRARFKAKREYIRQYDKERRQRPERKAKQAAYSRARNAREPEKARARRMVANHLRRGNLTRQPCEVGFHCFGRMEAHHDDYSKPLNIRWLCFKHHREHHGQIVAGETT